MWKSLFSLPIGKISNNSALESISLVWIEYAALRVTIWKAGVSTEKKQKAKFYLKALSTLTKRNTVLFIWKIQAENFTTKV